MGEIVARNMLSKAIAENKNAIVASCWTYFTTIKHDARNHKYKKKCDLETSWMRRRWSNWGLSRPQKRNCLFRTDVGPFHQHSMCFVPLLLPTSTSIFTPIQVHNLPIKQKNSPNLLHFSFLYRNLLAIKNTIYIFYCIWLPVTSFSINSFSY